MSAKGLRIDWDEIRQQLERSRRAIAGMEETDPAAQQRILQERAAALASRTTRTEQESEDGIEMLVIRIAGERYAFETAYVGQVYPMLPLTAIPGVPDFVVGIVSARGEVLSVIDLRSLLDLPLARLEDPGAIVVLQSETMEVGILVEELLGVQRYRPQVLEPAPPSLGNIEKTYLKGIAPERTGVLDASRLLDDPRLVVDAG